MNVYIPPRIRERMRPYDKYVNWSRIMRDAVIEELIRQMGLERARRSPQRMRKIALMDTTT